MLTEVASRFFFCDCSRDIWVLGRQFVCLSGDQILGADQGSVSGQTVRWTDRRGEGRAESLGHVASRQSGRAHYPAGRDPTQYVHRFGKRG